MARKFQIIRGKKANLPTLAQAELAMTTDSGAEGLYLGTGSENLEVLLAKDLDVSKQIEAHDEDTTAHEDIRQEVDEVRELAEAAQKAVDELPVMTEDEIKAICV